MTNKFVSHSILTSKDGLEFQEVKRDQTIQVQEKKLSFMTLTEQMVEQEKLDQLLRPEVTKMQRKKQTKPNIYEKTKPLTDEDNLEYVEESGFKQEIFNEEDFDFFQYYGQLREIENRKIKIEREHIKQFKQRRSELTIDSTPQIVVQKESQTSNKSYSIGSINVVKLKIKPPQFLEDLKHQNNKEETKNVDKVENNLQQIKNPYLKSFKPLVNDDDDDNIPEPTVQKKVKLVEYDSE
ncbi:unnamed protein product [Paramecium primaurelia]|uniref:Uncharacterized protein n=1 Tax=Paramecium primaurelia TaxID=5886 RepID=A0A8S1Q4Q3_PARPR|nr:unnamed protein product [Paramecium primaurelia]